MNYSEYEHLAGIEKELAAAVAKIEELERKSEAQTKMIETLQSSVEALKIGYAKMWVAFAIGGWLLGVFTPIIINHVWE